MDVLRAYWKLLLAVVAAVAVVVQTSITDDVIDPSEKIMIVSAVFGAILVYGAANPTLPFWQYTKALAQVGAAISAYLAVQWANGPAELTTSQWVTLGIIVLGALGVMAAPGPKLVTQGR